MNAFWWGRNRMNGGIKWLSWDRLCTVKEEGWLGFKKLKDFNIAMLEKQAWRLGNRSNSLVSNFIQARYYPDSDFLNASVGLNPSYLRRSIIAAQGVVKQGARKRIGNG
ncbi:putative mitochondrial protein AtMg00310 [Apium graveolens]|uniref:putative mitochondrial protein AtMg00310 n=1 Tax=Apium graveolens TaxID=4045 RepID=UPI003D7B244E